MIMKLKKKSLTKVLVLIASITFILPSHAQTSNILSQSEALQYIVRNNPTMRTLAMSASAEDILARGSGQVSGVEVEGEYMFGGSGAKNKWGVGISQGFDWPGAYASRRRAATAQAQAQWAEVEVNRNDLELETRLLFIDGVYNTKRLATLNILRVNLDSIARLIDYGYKHGELTILDLKKIHLELFKLDNEINNSQQLLSDINSRICVLAGDSNLMVDLSEYEMQPLLTFDNYICYAEQSPEVLAAYARADAHNLTTESSKLSRLPSFKLGYRHALEDGHHFNGITASIGLPSWGHNYDRDYNRALADVSLSQASIAVEQNKQFIGSDYTRALQLQSLMNNYSKVILDEEYIELMMIAYQGGQINVITMIQEINFFLESSLEYQKNDCAYRQILARLNSFVPCD